jgi:hypothetical protein
VKIVVNVAGNHEDGVEHEGTGSARPEQDHGAATEISQLGIPVLPTCGIDDGVAPNERIRVLWPPPIAWRWRPKWVRRTEPPRLQCFVLKVSDDLSLSYPFSPKGDVASEVGALDGVPIGASTLQEGAAMWIPLAAVTSESFAARARDVLRSGVRKLDKGDVALHVEAIVSHLIVIHVAASVGVVVLGLLGRQPALVLGRFPVEGD